MERILVVVGVVNTFALGVASGVAGESGFREVTFVEVEVRDARFVRERVRVLS